MDLTALTIASARHGLNQKAFSSRDLVSACLDRIQKIDGQVHAFLASNPRSRDEADRADHLLKNGAGEELPLLGIPVAVKDNFNTIGIRTTASSAILNDYVPVYDATVVRQLKEAGAIILGKTNLDAFAHGSSTETSDFGPTLNPWNPDYLPGGSSGGSAAAVSADETIFAIGSETAGSIRQPASWCGVVGLKPTYGRISRYGLIAMASSLDCPGPITKTVADARLVYEILAGLDPMDATTYQQTTEDRRRKTKITNLKIGLPKEYFRAEAQKGVNEAVLAAAAVLEKKGAILKDISLFDPQYTISVYTILQRSEVSSNLARFDGIRFGHPRDCFNRENRRRIMLGTYTLSAGYYDAYYKKAQQVRTLIKNDFHQAFTSVDLLLGPVSPTVALKRGASADSAMFGELQDILVEPSSLAGLPGIAVPCGFVSGLPVGFQLIGPGESESLILDVAAIYEQETTWHGLRPLFK